MNDKYYPIIAITCDFETITDSRGYPAPRYVCPESYVRAVRLAAGFPVLIAHGALKRDDEWPWGTLPVDGLVIAGGDFDIPPSYYGEAPRPGLGRLLESRSEAERRLCKLALKENLPLLAVCGGMQLLNVVCGGTLYQDLRDREATAEHEQPHDKRTAAHSVELAPDTLLHRIMSTDTLSVNSTHHQVIRELGQKLKVGAIAPDGVIEAIEVQDHPFALGVQWHPEILLSGEHQRLYHALVDAAKRQSSNPQRHRPN